ncbi:MAG: DegV family protein [Anaerolineae bacterium]|nr:DegV family protein [Anaerolineae bacterium]
MAKIAIVTDSTAACFMQAIGSVPLISVPLDVVWDGRTYRDGVDISAAQFYEQIKTARVMPTTSQPSPAAFQEAYQRLLDDGYQVLSMHISEGISGTVNSARQAKQLLGENAPIAILDSYVTAMVLKMQILEAAEAANQGASFAECVQLVESVRQRCGVYFTVSTLDYLERGGRMTKVQAFAGNLLQIRPILTFIDGKIHAIHKARTFNGALKSLKEHFHAAVAGRTIRNISATYTDNQAFVESFVAEVLEELKIERPAKAFVDPLTPVIGTHTGPGCVGLAYLLEE